MSNAMRTNGGLLSPLFTGGAVSLCRITSTRVVDGRLYANIDYMGDSDGRGVKSYQDCPVACLGGDVGSVFFTPVKSSDVSDGTTFHNEALAVHRTHGERPYIIATKQPFQLGLVQDRTEDPGADSDHDESISRHDFALRNAGALLLVDDNGAITLKTDVLRVQMDESGQFRISRDAEAGERVLLANAFTSWVNGALHSHLATQNARLTALEAQVAALTGAIAAGLVVTGTGTGTVTAGTAAGNPVSTAVTATATPATPVPSFGGAGTQVIPTSTPEHISSTILLSSKSMAD